MENSLKSGIIATPNAERRRVEGVLPPLAFFARIPLREILKKSQK
jgi:hypothetical protein